MNEIKNYKVDLEKRLHGLYFKQVLLSLLSVSLKAAGLFIFLILMFVLAESIGHFNSIVRSLFFFSSILIPAGYLLFNFYKELVVEHHLFSGPNYEELAMFVGSKIDWIKDDLKNAYQLVNSKGQIHSNELINAAFNEVYNKSKSIKFSSLADNDKIYSSAKINLPIILLSFVFLFSPFSQSLNRVLNYKTEFIKPPKYSFSVKPGNVRITKGEDVPIKIKVFGGTPDELNFNIKRESDYQFEAIKLRRDSTGNYSYVIGSVVQSFDYFVQVGDVQSKTYSIQVIDRPVIKGIDLTITPPSYSGLPKRVQKDNGNISALAGANVNLKIIADKPLKEAKIIFSDSTKKSFDLSNNEGSIDFTISKNRDYFISIKDTNDIANANPILYSINIIPDSNPFIELLNPREDILLGETDVVPILSKISDDYGFKKLLLMYKLSQSNFKSVDSTFRSEPIKIVRNKKEQEILYEWDLSKLALTENDVVSFYLIVYDNDYVNGPKTAKTKIINIRVPTLDELFAQADKKGEETVEDLEETFKEAEKLKDEFQKLANELKRKEQKVNWEEKEKLEQTAKKFEELQKKIEDVKKKIDDIQKSLEENKLLSPETLEKYNELQKLFDELTSEEMKKAMEQMQNSLSQLNRNQIQQSLENMKFNEEMIKNSLERTINLLKRIQIEQKLDELIKRTEEIKKKQEELKNKTQEAQSNAEREKLAKEQNALKKELQRLKEEMDKLQDKMNEVKDMPKDEMAKTKEEFEKQKNESLSEESKEKIQSGDMKSASQLQQQIVKNMQQMKSRLSQMKKGMQMKNQIQTMADMMKIINELLELSKKEEALKNKTGKLSGNSPQLGKIAREEYKQINSLNKVINKAVDLSQKTFAITPEMGKAMGMARNEMAQAISEMQNRNSQLGAKHQNGAMKYLNEAAQQMQNSMANMMNQSGGGMMSLMQQMQQLSQRQMNLNQLTKMMQGGKLTMEQMAQMQRLAKEQEALKKSLEELNEEIKKKGSKSKLTGNLEKILDEMKEVVKGMNTGKIDDELIKKQDRILSRMLDAQRSINERDYEKNRESVAGKEFNLNSPPEELLKTEEGRNILRERLMKAIQAGYAKDYEELIRKYFKELENIYKEEK